MEEGRIDRMIIRRNSNELKIELKKIHTQIIKLQKKRLGQKDKECLAHYKIPILEQSLRKSSSSPINPSEINASQMDVNIRNTSHNLDAIRQLINEGISSALKAQAAAMANSENSNRNTKPKEIPVAKRGNYTNS
ncbi:hypothetical protein Tco_0546461 [Tanacetum coccineum]